MKTFMKIIGCIVFGGLLLGSVGAARADDAYPSKPIRMIIPYPPGGTSDPLARLVGQKLSEKWGQPVVADNRSGGNTIIGTQELLKAAPDGYTILVTANSHVIVPHLIKTPYDPIKDFAPVATIASNPLILVVNPSVPANNVNDIIALAKQGKIAYASSGTGTVNHIAGELFDIRTGAKMKHVPYKGGSAALVDVVGGHVQMSFAMAGSMNFIKNDQVRPIAVTGEQRSPALPNVPTFTEAGLPNFDLMNWVGILAPANTPKPIIDKLSKAIGEILAEPDVKEKFAAQGVDPFISTPEQFTALIASDLKEYGQVIQTANIQIDK